MTLNEEYEFANAPLHVRRAFLRPPVKVLLEKNTGLYKWTSYDLVPGPDDITAWWFPVQTRKLSNGMVIEGFRPNEERAKRLGRSHREYARARAAVSDAFDNTMAALLMIQLLRPVWAFAGEASGQEEFKEADWPAEEWTYRKNVFLIGGASQIWVPHLKFDDVRRMSVIG